jgi:tetratricopeptide (TPR) repeat protein
MPAQSKLWAFALGLTLCPAWGQAQQHHDHAQGASPSAATLGEVHFPVSCTPEAQAAFDEAMKLQHSFWYQAASEAFRRVRERDPTCVMAYWGEAMALLVNPFTVTTATNLRQGRAVLAATHRSRLERYEQAMSGLYERFSDDPEVGIHYALALAMAAPPTDKTYARQLRGAEILERAWARQPQHPGIAHYLIHTYDTPALAARGVAAAERYAGIAADAPHALHMPSHIFTRIGRWEDSIETNRRSAETARARQAVFDEIHALDYMVYGYLQTGQIEAARRVVTDLGRFASWSAPAPIFAWALTVMPARFALERGAWEEAAALSPGQQTAPLVVANTHFARAVGAARARRPDAAATDIEALKAAAAALRSSDAYWAEQMETLRLAADAWVAFARSQHDQAVTIMQEASEREGRTDKHPVTPGPLLPAREQLGEMLLMMGRYAEAQREYEAVQKTEPGRFRTTYGAGRAAELGGDGEAARRHYAHLLEVAARAQPGLAELNTHVPS